MIDVHARRGFGCDSVGIQTTLRSEVTCRRCLMLMERRSTSPRSLSSLFMKGHLARLLREEDDSVAHQTGVSGASLDAQVDRYLAEYESSSKKSEEEDEVDVSQMESIDWRDLIKGRLILEAGEGDKDEEEAVDAAPGADAMTGDDEEKLGVDKLDVEAFANDIARLIENYDNLLEVRSTLLRRARSFLEKTYDDEVLDAFDASMRDDHGMEAGSSESDIENDRFVAPAADRANGSAQPTGGGAPV